MRVLFLCTGNSARSQMAQALLERASDGRLEVASAGVEAKAVNPLTVRALGEVGIDWSRARSKPMTAYFGQDFDLVVTVCDEAREACPVFPGARRQEHWPFEDPADASGTEEERLTVFRRVRDEIDAAVRAFLARQPEPAS